MVTLVIYLRILVLLNCPDILDSKRDALQVIIPPKYLMLKIKNAKWASNHPFAWEKKKNNPQYVAGKKQKGSVIFNLLSTY